MRDYKKIEAWRYADDLAVLIYNVTRGFPRQEVYGLTSQLRRAGYSAPSNIAEGASRQTKKDYLHFLYIARGSLAETEYFVHLANRLGLLGPEELNQLEGQINATFSRLHGLIKAVEKEAGVLGRLIAPITSALVLLFFRHGPGNF
jgi:four helix bundle protein